MEQGEVGEGRRGGGRGEGGEGEGGGSPMELLHTDALTVIASFSNRASFRHLSFANRYLYNFLASHTKFSTRKDYPMSLGEFDSVTAVEEAFQFLSIRDIEPLFAGVFTFGNRRLLEGLMALASSKGISSVNCGYFSLRTTCRKLGRIFQEETQPSSANSFLVGLFRTFYEFAVVKDRVDFLKWLQEEGVLEFHDHIHPFLPMCFVTGNAALANWAASVMSRDRAPVFSTIV